jgi:protein-S-isoprenylcysteine O-methyltransferase Ste14
MLTLKLIGSVLINLAIFAALLFIPAGTLHWWRAWVFLGVVAICCSATMFAVFAKNEELLNERYKGPIQKEQPFADRIILLVFVSTFFAAVILIPLEVFRFHLLAPPGIFVSLLGLIMFIAGWCVISFALKANTFAAPVVKHQQERDQKVIDTGLYGWVRHPMYTSVPLLLVGMALWLGSYAAALFAIVPIAMIAIRIVFEEQFLRGALAGYDSYVRKVRYRMIPFLW